MAVISWPTIKSLAAFRKSKYKQRRVLASLDLLNDPAFRVGACTGLSLLWLKAYKKDPSAGSAKSRTKGLSLEGQMAMLKLCCQTFNANLAMFTNDETRMQVVARAFLGQGDLGIRFSKAQTANLAPHLDLDPNYGLCLMVLTGAPTNHICAYVQDGTSLTFFDPNSGEYRVANSERDAFFQALHAQYETYVSAGGKKIALTISQWILASVRVF